MVKNYVPDPFLVELKEDLTDVKTKIDSISSSVAVFSDMKADIKMNTEFRNKATGVIGFAAFIFTAIGAFVMWACNKLYF